MISLFFGKIRTVSKAHSDEIDYLSMKIAKNDIQIRKLTVENNEALVKKFKEDNEQIYKRLKELERQ